MVVAELHRQVDVLNGGYALFEEPRRFDVEC